GLWQPWRPADDPKGWIVTATIITGPAGPDTEDLHDRQPVILEPDLWDAWLDPQNHDLAELEAMLHSAPGGTLVAYAVDARVGNVRNNDAHLVEPVSDLPNS
ncbi:MAG TPA: SOS response-associated peptidase family protein, partial [Acidimicrobiales bacterium]